MGEENILYVPNLLTSLEAKERHNKIALDYFNRTPTIGNIYNGVINWLKGYNVLEAEGSGLQTGEVPIPGIKSSKDFVQPLLTINKFKRILKDYNPYRYKPKRLPEIKISDKIINSSKNIKIDVDNLYIDKFVKYLEKQTGRKIKRVLYKNTKDGDLYKEGFSFIDLGGKEIAHIAGNLKGKNVWVESSYVAPEFRHKGLGKLMYFDFNDHTYSTYGTTLHSHASLRVGYIDGEGMSPSNRLWKSLTDKKLATTEGSGFNWWNIMENPSKIPTAYRKQGGKMDILQFLKSGSGIHIKKENRGKFTDYCGGKVTSECIAKGKRSSNPAIRKRATFAANARKWKHEDGGRVKKHLAFVNGVSVLDSNPDAYKYVKKKIKKAADGGNSKNWFSGVGNWLNKNLNTISTIGSAITNGIGLIKQNSELSKAKAAKEKELDAKYNPNNLINDSEIWNEVNNQISLLKLLNPDVHYGEVDKLNLYNKVRNQYLSQAKQYALFAKTLEQQLYNLYISDAQAGNTSSLMNLIGNGISTGIGMLGNKSTTSTGSVPTGTTTTSYSSYVPGYTPSLPKTFSEYAALNYKK